MEAPARITPFSTGDCLKKIPNEFEVALVASRRLRELQNGAKPLVPDNGDHNKTIALREIAEGLVGREYLYKAESKPKR